MLLQVLSFCSDSKSIWQFVGRIIDIIQIVIPVIIVILAMLDLGKAVMAGEDKEIKAAQSLLVKRLIYGVVIFFVFVIVQVVFGLVGQNPNSSDAKECWSCVTNPGSC